MRIQRKNVFLTLELKYSTDSVSVNVYNSDFELLPTIQRSNNDTKIIQISINMPDLIIVAVTGSNQDHSVELVNMSLAGIKINANTLSKLIDHKSNLTLQPHKSVKEHYDFPGDRSTVWRPNSCIFFNLFDTDPFAYHMHVGNKIQF